jgi:hypothetical protein
MKSIIKNNSTEVSSSNKPVEQEKRGKESGIVSPYQGLEIRKLVLAIDSFYAKFVHENARCQREISIVGGIALIFEINGREIGTFSIQPGEKDSAVTLPEPGFSITIKASETSEIERLIFWDIMDDLEWDIKGQLGLRPKGGRFKIHPLLANESQIQAQAVDSVDHLNLSDEDM